jgi:hypothetical protein
MDIITAQEGDTLLPGLPQTRGERNNLSTRSAQGPRSLSLAVSMEPCFAPQQNVPISRTFTCHKTVHRFQFSVLSFADCILDRPLWFDRRAGQLRRLHDIVERPAGIRQPDVRRSQFTVRRRFSLRSYYAATPLRPTPTRFPRSSSPHSSSNAIDH